MHWWEVSSHFYAEPFGATITQWYAGVGAGRLLYISKALRYHHEWCSQGMADYSAEGNQADIRIKSCSYDYREARDLRLKCLRVPHKSTYEIIFNRYLCYDLTHGWLHVMYSCL